MSPLPLSVIVPVYNVAPYLSRCLDSILAQTRPVAEIVCVDDGSTDGSGEILDAYAGKYAQVRVIHKENGGQSSARKAGLRVVSTPYVTCVDADDWIEPCMYEELMDVMLRTDSDVVTSGYFWDRPQRQTIMVDPIDPGLYEGVRLAELQRNVFSTERFDDNPFALSIWDKIYRTELLRTFQMPVDERIFIGEDFAVTWPLLLHAQRVYETGRTYYHYCWRAESIYNKKEQQAIEEQGLNALLTYLRKALLPLQATVSNIGEQYRMYELLVLYLRGAWNLCEERYGDALRPFGDIPKAARIALYGAGAFGGQLKAYLDVHGYNVVLWVDQSQSRAGVEPPSRLLSADYDLLLIGVLKWEAVQGILRNLAAIGVAEEKIRKIEAERILGRQTV